MRPRRMLCMAPLLLLAVGIAVMTAGCGDGVAEPVTTYTGTDGAELYAQACARCHGVDLRGTEQGPPLQHAVYRSGHHADAAFLLAVRQGVRPHHWDFGRMPPIRGLSDEQVEAITRFVRERQRAAGIE